MPSAAASVPASARACMRILGDGRGLPEVSAPEAAERPQPVLKRSQHRSVLRGGEAEPVRPGPGLTGGEQRAHQRILQGAHVHHRAGRGDGQVDAEHRERPGPPRPELHGHPAELLRDRDQPARVTDEPPLGLERRDARPHLWREPVPEGVEPGAQMAQEPALLHRREPPPDARRAPGASCPAPPGDPRARRPPGPDAPARAAPAGVARAGAAAASLPGAWQAGARGGRGGAAGPGALAHRARARRPRPSGPHREPAPRRPAPASPRPSPTVNARPDGRGARSTRAGARGRSSRARAPPLSPSAIPRRRGRAAARRPREPAHPRAPPSGAPAHRSRGGARRGTRRTAAGAGTPRGRRGLPGPRARRGGARADPRTRSSGRQGRSADGPGPRWSRRRPGRRPRPCRPASAARAPGSRPLPAR